MTHTHNQDSPANIEPACTVRVLCVTCSRHLREELQRLGLPQREVSAAEKSSQSFVLKLLGLGDPEISALRSVFEAGGMHITAQNAPSNGRPLIVSGSCDRLDKVTSESHEMIPRLAGVLRKCRTALDSYLRDGFKVTYPGGELDLARRTAIMGVVNVTPDSFSDGGDFFSAETAAEHALRLVEAGADIIDIGGESTRPGSKPVGHAEEIKRVLPVIEAVVASSPVPVSIDTYKPEVAREALAAGAGIINDVSGLRENSGMAELAASEEVPVILMHMKGSPRTMQENPVYEDLVSEIYASLSGSVDTALKAGISRDRIIIDPGIGFGKTFEDNLVILDRLHEFRSLGVPICIGVSRKSFLGATLGITEPKKRLIGSLAANIIAVRAGARIVRVHDVRETVEAVRVADAIAAGRLPTEA